MKKAIYTLLSCSLLLACQPTTTVQNLPEESHQAGTAPESPTSATTTGTTAGSETEAIITPATPVLSELEYGAQVMSAFADQQKETIGWLQENNQPAAVTHLTGRSAPSILSASPATPAAPSEDSPQLTPSTPILPSSLNKSLINTIKASNQRLDTQLRNISYPPSLREGHQKLLRMSDLKNKYFAALEVFLIQSDYQQLPSPEQMRDLLSEAENAELERLAPEANTFLSQLLTLALEVEIETLHQVVIYDSQTYLDRVKPLFQASMTFNDVPHPLQYLRTSEAIDGPEAITGALQQIQQKTKQNLAAIARIRPPEAYKEAHLVLYAQEKFNLLMLNIYTRIAHTNTSANPSTGGSILQLLQQVIEDPEFLSANILIPLLREHADMMQDRLGS